MSYHYVVASLPMLFFGAPPPIHAADWRAQLQDVLPAADLVFVDAFLKGQPTGGNEFAQHWLAGETQLRNAIARARAAKLGVESRPYQRDHDGYDMTIEDAVTNAFTKPNPLEREKEFDRWRWHRADELAQLDPFGLAAILAFAVQLRIAERWAAMQESEGRQAVEEFVEFGSVHARWEERESHT